MPRRMRKLALLPIIFTLASLPSDGAAKDRLRVITQCPWDGNSFSLYDPPKATRIGTYDLLTIDGQWGRDETSGAIFSIKRSGQVIFGKEIRDMYNPNGWIGVSNDLRSFAFNTSNGGAAGGWSVTILRLSGDGTIADLTKSMQTVESDFSARHYCKTRGDNYEAIQWRSNDQLLISASVYGTSDCGKEMGYTEGYVLNVATGKIVAHMSEQEMLNLPYVCTYNVWQPGDPEPGR